MTHRETMTSRERVLKSLNHQVPDRVPVDLGGFQTGIHKKAYERLLNHLGLREEIVTLDPVQQLAAPGQKVLERFHVDTRYLLADAPEGFDGRVVITRRSDRTWHDLTDEFGVVWSMPEDQGLYMDISRHPLAAASLKEIRDYPFRDGSDPSRFASLRSRAVQLREQTPYAVCTGIGGVVYEYCWYLRGLERWFIDMIEQPELCELLLDKMLEYWKAFYTGFLTRAGDLVDVVMIGDDLAGQSGPLFSPDFYRSVVKPRHRALVSHIKSLTTAKIWYHTCGSVVRIIPDLIDNGIDILNPVQISAANMDPKMLKHQYGDRLVFWGGGIDTQHVLSFASPQQITEHVRRNLEIFKPGGAYVFNSIHNIQADVPPENVEAMFDAAHEYGFYG
jgi:uroporphyrinogen decarboxylase